MRLLLFLILIAVAATIIIRFICEGMQMRKCTGTAIGYFAYSDCVESPNPQNMRNLWVPVYEFTVGDMKYLVRSGRGGPGERSFPIEAKVRYDTNNPEICFVDGVKGRIISRYKKEESWNEYYEELIGKIL